MKIRPAGADNVPSGRMDRDEAKSRLNINRHAHTNTHTHTISFVARPSPEKLAASHGNYTIRCTASGLAIKETPCMTLKCVIYSPRNTQTDEF